jgi:hypothetical protein
MDPIDNDNTAENGGKGARRFAARGMM